VNSQISSVKAGKMGQYEQYQAELKHTQSLFMTTQNKNIALTSFLKTKKANKSVLVGVDIGINSRGPFSGDIVGSNFTISYAIHSDYKNGINPGYGSAGHSGYRFTDIYFTLKDFSNSDSKVEITLKAAGAAYSLEPNYSHTIHNFTESFTLNNPSVGETYKMNITASDSEYYYDDIGNSVVTFFIDYYYGDKLLKEYYTESITLLFPENWATSNGRGFQT
jgi:hypothetical protein